MKMTREDTSKTYRGTGGYREINESGVLMMMKHSKVRIGISYFGQGNSDEFPTS